MGWWETNEEGVSFAHSRDGMVWGDGPADIVDGALHDIRRQYIAEWGRLPSRAEIIAGLSFSLRVFLQHLPEHPQESPLTDDEQSDYSASLFMLAKDNITASQRERSRQTITAVEAKFASEDDEVDEESDADFEARFPKLLSLMNDKVGALFAVPGPNVGSEAESDAQAPSSEEAAAPLKLVQDTDDPFTFLKHLYGKPVVARYTYRRTVESAEGPQDIQAERVVRGILRHREDTFPCTDSPMSPYLLVENFNGGGGLGSSNMEITPLTLDDLRPDELREWNLSEPVAFTQFVIDHYMTKGW